ncbi:MAG: hypothetical protein E7070_06090 [Bacteroidales bacterium]|nr:hypothetical protein [Bacteroidales bacterium]
MSFLLFCKGWTDDYCKVSPPRHCTTGPLTTISLGSRMLSVGGEPSPDGCCWMTYAAAYPSTPLPTNPTKSKSKAPAV